MTANPINPVLLKWARETSGLSTEDVAKKMGRKSVTSNTITDWETGSQAPNYIQLETLAYKIYKRPIAIFFFPRPPEEGTPREAFRTLPDVEIQRLSPRMHFLIRKAKTMQLNLRELYDGVNPAEHQIVRNIKFAPNASTPELAKTVRQYLGIKLDQQKKWRTADDAFKNWRILLERFGIFVFKDAFRDNAISGFCLYDDQFPLIYINNSRAHNHQIFTLFHELAHLLSGTGGIDKLKDTYISALRGQDRYIEILCNAFAGAFLVPDDDFDNRIYSIPINEETISTLAKRYSVSKEVILRKLLDRGLVSQGQYERMVESWKKQGKSKSSGGDHYLNIRAYLGDSYLNIAFSRLYQNKISPEQLADYLGIKVGQIPKLETLVLSTGTST